MKQETHVCPVLMKTVRIDTDSLRCSEKCRVEDCPVLHFLQRKCSKQKSI